MAKIDSVYDFSDKGLVELKSWLEPWFLKRDTGTTSGTGSYSELVLAESSLVAYWPLDEASGDALDASGHGHDLLAANFVGTLTQGSPGPFPSVPAQTSYTFGGGYLPRSDLALDGGGGTGVTLECWLYPTAYPAFVVYVIQAGNLSTPFVAIMFDFRSTHEVSFVVSNSAQVFSSGGLALNTWAHVSATCSVADGMRVYFNGVQVGTAAGIAPTNMLSNRFVVGSGQDGVGTYHAFTGRIAQVALYTDVLSASTLLAHYERGAHGLAPGPSFNLSAGESLSVVDSTGATIFRIDESDGSVHVLSGTTVIADL